MSILLSFEQNSRVVTTGDHSRPDSRGAGTRYKIYPRATNSINSPCASSLCVRQTARGFGSGPLLHGMADIREFATACFVWGCIAMTGFALFVAWFVATTLIYWG